MKSLEGASGVNKQSRRGPSKQLNDGLEMASTSGYRLRPVPLHRTISVPSRFPFPDCAHVMSIPEKSSVIRQTFQSHNHSVPKNQLLKGIMSLHRHRFLGTAP